MSALTSWLLPIACRIGRHTWHTTRTESIRYGVLVTRCCLICGIERTESRW